MIWLLTRISLPPSLTLTLSFSLIYINNWGLSRKDTWCGSESGAQRISVPLLLAMRKIIFMLIWYDQQWLRPADCLFVNFLPATVILLVDEISYSVSWQPLGSPRLTHHKVHICHQLIVEHYWISMKEKKHKNSRKSILLCRSRTRRQKRHILEVLE